MTSKSPIDFIRRILQASIDWLNRIEKSPPRSKKRPWYNMEIHIPPMVVAIISGLALFGLLNYALHSNLKQSISLAIFLTIAVCLFVLYLVTSHKKLAQSEDAMGLLSVTFFITVILIIVCKYLSDQYDFFSPYLTPIAMAPLLTALLIHPRLALVLSFVISLVFGVINNFSMPACLVGSIGGAMAVALGTQSRTGHQIVKAGFGIGLIQAVIVIFLAVQMDWPQYKTTVAVSSALASGMLAAFLSWGALPFLEILFSQTSNLRLLELSDINHPLLKKMSIEAPGTYHHSQIVASLAENAGNAIGANGLLCRVGAYFHDIGKIVKPEYFIENQGTFGNPHDAVSPSLSKLVITSHVKEGLALAKAYKLDRKIIEFIPQHHGTCQIEYFYKKALNLEKQEEADDQEDVSVESYRYPGPKPQSKEAGIIMLADSTEAASRTLEEPNHQRFKDLVYKIVNKKVADGQLDETDLTLQDIHTIAERFTSSLTSIHHSRIAYPEDEKKKGVPDPITPK